MSSEAVNLAWDYSALAQHYEHRAPYAANAVAAIFRETAIEAGVDVADIGAGTGRLSVMLASAGLRVHAIEPNAAMREVGRSMTRTMKVAWSDSTGESTRLDDASVHLVCYGSSFNVLDRTAALREASRVLRPDGWIACLWNHRDLDDPIQRKIEAVIRRRLPSYALGTRREDPGDVIRDSGLFGAAHSVDCEFMHHTSRDIFVAGFRAHATLIRQAGNQLDAILDEMSEALPKRISVPFSTRIWLARKTRG